MTRFEQPLAFQLKSLNNNIKRMMERSAITENDANLTGMQYAILGFVSQQDTDQDIFQRDIEAEFNIRRSTASGLLQKLEQDGFITRVGVPGDARLKKIVRTAKAKELDKKASANMVALNERMTRGITQQELDQFNAVLAKMIENVRD